MKRALDEESCFFHKAVFSVLSLQQTEVKKRWICFRRKEKTWICFRKPAKQLISCRYVLCQERTNRHRKCVLIIFPRATSRRQFCFHIKAENGLKYRDSRILGMFFAGLRESLFVYMETYQAQQKSKGCGCYSAFLAGCGYYFAFEKLY